jgi:hypothetical protein
MLSKIQLEYCVDFWRLAEIRDDSASGVKLVKAMPAQEGEYSAHSWLQASQIRPQINGDSRRRAWVQSSHNI